MELLIESHTHEGMAPSSDADEPNDFASSDPPTEDTTVTKKRSLNSSTGTLTSPFFSSTRSRTLAPPFFSSTRSIGTLTSPFFSSTRSRTLTPPSNSHSIGTLTSPSSSSITTLRNSLHIQPPPLPTLPFDVIVKILYKLPVKYLMQFQCVCKSWKSLISDPKFAKEHLRISKKHHHLISISTDSVRANFIYMSYPLSSIFTEVTAMQQEYPLTIRHRFDYIVASCHGILCIVMHHDDSVILWNPSIRKFTKLPCLEKSLYGCYGFSFGYDYSSDTYKVVACLCNVYVGVWKPLVKVHTLGSNSWRTIQDFPSGLVRENGSGKFVCGTINWLTFRSVPNPISSWCIISLDLEKESYREIMQPDYGGVTLTCLKLGVVRDCLSIFFRSDTFSDIWFMKEYGNKESWIKLFRVPDIRDLGSYPYVCALYVSEDDQVLLNIKSELVIYNSRDGTFMDLNIRNTYGLRRRTQVYQESLISPCF